MADFLHKRMSRPALLAGVYDALSARLAQSAGFEGLWLSSFCLSASRARADNSLLSVSDYLDVLQDIRLMCRLPIVVDCESGFGGLEQLAHVAHRLALIGVEGISIEDNPYPKISSLQPTNQRRLESADLHAQRITHLRAILDADGANETPAILARTESLVAGLSIDNALARCETYVAAGADAIVVHSVERSPESLFELAARWQSETPLVAIPTTYSDVTADDLFGHGYSVIIYANQALRASAEAVRRVLQHVRRTGAIAPDDPTLMSFDRLMGRAELGEPT